MKPFCLKSSDDIRSQPRRGFSLVELLVTVAIIGVLAALLLPGFSRSKDSAQRIRCVANLRQLALATHLYWDENGGNCFRYGGSSTNGGQLYWFGWMGSGAEGERPFDVTQGALYPYLRGRGVELCPAFKSFLPQIKLKASTATYGYGYNLFLSAAQRVPAINVARLTRPSENALLADAAQVNTWQAPASKANPMLEEWYYIDNSTNQPNGHFRHHQRANVAFCDGHVAAERPMPGSLDSRMPGELVGLYRLEILVLP